MAVDAKKVYVGTPDQLTTGAILQAPLGTTMPDLNDITPTKVTIGEAFKDCGYVSEDGVTIAPDYSTSDIIAWGGAVVRRILESFVGEISFTIIQTDEAGMKMVFGDDHVTAQAATADHGNQLKAALGAYLPEQKAWVFKMKDGSARMLIVVPIGQVTAIDEITFNNTDPVGYAVTLTTSPDKDGNNIYILTDDGEVATA